MKAIRKRRGTRRLALMATTAVVAFGAMTSVASAYVVHYYSGTYFGAGAVGFSPWESHIVRNYVNSTGSPGYVGCGFANSNINPVAYGTCYYDPSPTFTGYAYAKNADSRPLTINAHLEWVW